MARSAYVYLVWLNDSELVWAFTVKHEALHAIARSGYATARLTMERRPGWSAKLEEDDAVAYDIEKELLAEGLTGPFVVTFHGRGGYPVDRKAANGVLVVGQKYTVESVSVSQLSSWIKLVGVDGSWNSVLFSMERHHKMWLNAMDNAYSNGEAQP